VIQLAPPLIVGQTEFDDIESRLRSVLKGAEAHL
jgi:acetylornithine/succinyldiaminopimelate/putrescine aminotransferase